MSPPTPEIADLQQQFSALGSAATELAAGLSGPQFNWRPHPTRWSIAECLLHLNMVGHQYSRTLEAVLDAAAVNGPKGNGPFRHGIFGRWLLANTEPPPKRTSKAPRRFRPPEDQPVTAVLPTFIHLQDQMCRFLEQANGLDLIRVKVSPEGLGPVKLSLYLTFAWIAAHERRHLWQARQVREHAAFPAK